MKCHGYALFLDNSGEGRKAVIQVYALLCDGRYSFKNLFYKDKFKHYRIDEEKNLYYAFFLYFLIILLQFLC